MSPSPDPPRNEWVVIVERRPGRWGGELRRARIFRGLAERTGAAVVGGWRARPLLASVRHAIPSMASGRGRPKLASGEMLHPSVLAGLHLVTHPTAVAIYDDPVAQSAALGVRLPPERESSLRARRDANANAFRWHVVPTASFAELVGLDAPRVIVGENGTDVRHVTPGAWPERPSIGMVSGAAPGRGIELLIEAARSLRARHPDLSLMLWLTATGPASGTYLEGLRQAVARDAWIALGSVPYEGLGEALARAGALVIPHPPNDYLDAALPVKLLDSMAAGRPVVVTPRRETAAIVRRHGAGVVADGDTVDDVAAALDAVLSDDAAARAMGAAAREAAERHYDWQVVGARIADEILSREDADRPTA